MFKNIWRKLSSGQKITMMGSLLLILSLFLNWFSDKDIFRSGDTYTALAGPLYLPGLTILLAAVFTLGIVVLAALRNKHIMALGSAAQGKMQMLAGFLSMYLLIVINSVYFHPRFGLNILEKKSEIGVTLALVATVLICVGGYLCYRRKFETAELTPSRSVPAATTSIPTPDTTPTPAPLRQHVPLETVSVSPLKTPTAVPVEPVTSAPSPNSTPGGAGGYFPERNPRGKTDYERARLYENLKRTMVRDTLTPEQRRKLKEKEIKENAFSANFGKNAPVPNVKNTVSSAAKTGPRSGSGISGVAADSPSAEKKPQMYRMDL